MRNLGMQFQTCSLLSYDFLDMRKYLHFLAKTFVIIFNYPFFTTYFPCGKRRALVWITSVGGLVGESSTVPSIYTKDKMGVQRPGSRYFLFWSELLTASKRYTSPCCMAVFTLIFISFFIWGGISIYLISSGLSTTSSITKADFILKLKIWH